MANIIITALKKQTNLVVAQKKLIQAMKHEGFIQLHELKEKVKDEKEEEEEKIDNKKSFQSFLEHFDAYLKEEMKSGQSNQALADGLGRIKCLLDAMYTRPLNYIISLDFYKTFLIT